MQVSKGQYIIDKMDVYYSVKKATSFCQHPSPFCELYFTFLQSLVAVVEGRYPLF